MTNKAKRDSISPRQAVERLIEAYTMNEFKVVNGKPVGPIDPRKQMERDAHEFYQEAAPEFEGMSTDEHRSSAIDHVSDRLFDKHYKTFGHDGPYEEIAKKVVGKYV